MKTHRLEELEYRNGWYIATMLDVNTGNLIINKFPYYDKAEVIAILRKKHDCVVPRKFCGGER